MASPNAGSPLKLGSNHKYMSPPSAASDASAPAPAPAPAPATATENPRPILKVNTSSKQLHLSGDRATPTPTERKIKIKINSQPGTPIPTTSSQAPGIMKTKAGRTSKPTAKVTESKKRPYESDEDIPLAATRVDGRPSKTIKLTQKPPPAKPPPVVSTPVSAIRFKSKGELIAHTPGDAYDSEASDRETDPHRETNFILRVPDDESAQYLNKALAEGTIGHPKTSGGADFAVQFIDGKERRAMVTINGIYYAAVLVQLPTITEAMKTWDRRSMMKNSDITEMLLCFAVVEGEPEARTLPLPPMVIKNDLKWPHGITPPMHDAPNRRFRKALSEKQWERTQNVVTKLLEDDAAADEVRMDVIMEDDGEVDYDDDEDAEGEMDLDDYFGDHTQQSVDLDAEAELEEEDLLREFLADDEELGGATPATQPEAPTPMTISANTPMPLHEEPASEEDDEDEEDISDEDEDDDEADDDDGGHDRERKQQLGELHELQKQLEEAESKLSSTTMPILRRRISSSIDSIKKEMSVKKAALGLIEED